MIGTAGGSVEIVSAVHNTTEGLQQLIDKFNNKKTWQQIFNIDLSELCDFLYGMQSLYSAQPHWPHDITVLM